MFMDDNILIFFIVKFTLFYLFRFKYACNVFFYDLRLSSLCKYFYTLARKPNEQARATNEPSRASFLARLYNEL